MHIQSKRDSQQQKQSTGMFNGLFEGLFKNMFASLACSVLLLSSATLAFADSQRPAEIKTVDARVNSDNAVELSWDKPWDDTGIRGYNVYRNGRYIATISERDYEDDDVEAGESYVYHVTSFDFDRNHSSKSPATEITVNADSTSSSAASSRASDELDSFGPPSQLSGSEVARGEVRWEWSEVEDTVRYEVTVDGIYVGDTEETSYYSDDLWRGNHSLTIKSVHEDGYRSEQSQTFKVYVRNEEFEGAEEGRSNDSDETDNNIDNEISSNDDDDDGDSSEEQSVSLTLLDDESDNGLVDPISYRMPNIGKDGYDLVFSDEFNGGSVNAARWATNLRWDGDYNGERYEYRIINRESQFYVSPLSEDDEHLDLVVPRYNPFKFDGEKLSIKATRNPFHDNDGDLSYGPLEDMLEQQPFLSGALSTHNTFWRKYGYFEARIKIPSHVGTFPAFWLYAKNRRSQGSQRTEIDIMENLGHAPWYVYNSMHYFKNASPSYGGDHQFIKPEPQGQIYTGTDYSENFHVYAIKWEPGYVEWLIDGETVSQVWHEAADNEELYITINMAIGGSWTNYPSNAGGLGRSSDEYFPTDEDIREFDDPELQIDYIRVYERD